MAQQRDPYQVLGVQRTASADEIKKAHRKLVRQYHPDRNPGDAKAEERFKEVQQAYDLLSDPEKRKAYDRGGFGATGSAGGNGPFGGFLEADCDDKPVAADDFLGFAERPVRHNALLRNHSSLNSEPRAGLHSSNFQVFGVPAIELLDGRLDVLP